MTEINAILEYLRDNPKAMNPEIADNLKIDVNNVKANIGKLKARGYIEVQGRGNKNYNSIKRNACIKAQL